MRTRFAGFVFALSAVVAGSFLNTAQACPFCSAQSQTLSEELKGASAAIVGRYLGPVESSADKSKSSPTSDAESTAEKHSRFAVVKVLVGEKLLAGKQTIETLYFGDREPGTTFLIIGQDPNDLVWNTPTPLSNRGILYVSKLITLPEAGPERLEFIQEYFQDEDALLAGDAYDEFARAPYADIQALQGKLHRDKLLGWIEDRETSTSRRRLYLTLLGICGQPEDVSVLEKMIRNEDRAVRGALDALVACYITLKGDDALPLIEELFLSNAKAEYTDTYSTIMALRFLGQETKIVPRDRLAKSLRLMLARPQLADLVIPDLARWQDWTVMPDLVKLFKDAKEDTIWVRVPVINYLRACPLPEAKVQIDELAKIDPDAVRRASSFFPLGTAATPPEGAQRPKTDAAKGDAATSNDSTTPAAQKKSKSGDAETKAPAATKTDDTNKKATRVEPAAGRAPALDDEQPTASPVKVLSYAAGAGAVMYAAMAVVLHGGQPRG